MICIPVKQQIKLFSLKLPLKLNLLKVRDTKVGFYSFPSKTFLLRKSLFGRGSLVSMRGH